MMNMMKPCIALLLLSCSFAAAQSTPVDAAATFLTAVDRGDLAAVAASIDQRAGDASQAMAVARSLIATRRVAATLHEHFGLTADPIGVHPLPTTQALQTASLAADESHATLQTADGSISLVNRDGVWKLRLLEDSLGSVQQLWLTNHLASAMNDVADGVRDGKYATLDAAKHALQLSMGAVVTKLMVNDSVTTRPSTMP